MRLARDEADIVALAPDKQTMVIVEVKTRLDNAFDPTANITREKQRHLARFAGRLLQQKRYEGRAIRFDVIAIVWPEGGEPDVTHYEAAFDSPF